MTSSNDNPGFITRVADDADRTPASQALATVVRGRRAVEVRLPARFAKAAVERLLQRWEAVGGVLEGAASVAMIGRALRDDEWGILVAHSRWPLHLLSSSTFRSPAGEVHLFPRYTVVLGARQARALLQALEAVKPEELDDAGRPLPWVSLKPLPKRVDSVPAEDDDALLVDAVGPIPPIDADEPAPDLAPFVTDAEVVVWFEKLCTIAGFDVVPLVLRRGEADRHGLTTGRVWYPVGGAPRRVLLDTCPNSDLAEVLATIVHELAHPLSRTHVHGDPFKRSLVDLACRAWGDRCFSEARRRVWGDSPVLDRWISSGIRAALRGSDPPVPKAGDDGQLARVVTRLRKLRELADDQRGLPEGITATATANDLVTAYELGSYELRIDAGIHDQMVDRWIVLEDGAVWRRELLTGVASFCDVFALAIPAKARMHLFGRYSDLVQAEYLFTISAERIARESDRHLETWRRRQTQPHAGGTRRERTNFCDSAARAFTAKLRAIKKEDTTTGAAPDRLNVAEAFSLEEHQKRGARWTSGGSRATYQNDAGSALGRSLEVVRGLDSTGGPRRQLPPRR